MSLFYLLNGSIPQTDKKSIANEFSRTLIRKDIDEAWTTLNAIKADTAHVYLDEQTLELNPKSNGAIRALKEMGAGQQH